MDEGREGEGGRGKEGDGERERERPGERKNHRIGKRIKKKATKIIFCIILEFGIWVSSFSV